MRTRLLGFTSALLLSLSLGAGAAQAAAARTIEVKTQKIGDVMHWVPEAIAVKPGEKIHFVVKHELAGGFEFHGFSIPELKISKQINRNKPLEFDVEIPTDMKEGSYKIACQFHAAHKASELNVKK